MSHIKTQQSTSLPETDVMQVPALYLRTLMELMQDMGSNPGAWLADMGIDSRQFTQPTVALSTASYVTLVHAAIQQTQEPALGLLVGRRLRMNAHGKLAFAVMNSASLREAASLVERFLLLRTHLLTARFVDSPVAPCLVFTPAVDLGQAELLILEAVMLAVRNAFDYLAPGTQAVQAVAFAAPATSYQALAQELFACPVQHGATGNTLHLNPRSLDVALPTADAQALEHAAVMCQAELDKLTERTSITARIQRRLLDEGGATLSLQATARLLHMTPRTLHRRLQDEGTSYRAIIDRVRHRLALQHLKNSAISLQEIAYRLGYTDQANFRRAFKRWEGVAPQVAREDEGWRSRQG